MRWILKLLSSNCCILDLSWIHLSFSDIGLLDKDLSYIYKFRFVRNSLDLLETSRRHILKRSWRRFQHNNFLSSKTPFKTWLQDVFWEKVCLEAIFKSSWRSKNVGKCLKLKKSCEEKTVLEEEGAIKIWSKT